MGEGDASSAASAARDYKIGDFARRVGVSAAFLKHQEKFGIFSPEQAESGYRYYRFSQTGRVYASLAYQNLGFSLREITELLNASSLDAISAQMDVHAEAAGEEAMRLAELSEAAADICVCLRRCAQGPTWYVEDVPDRVFLAHARGADFIDDDRLPELQHAWSHWLPAVASCRVLGMTQGGTPVPGDVLDSAPDPAPDDASSPAAPSANLLADDSKRSTSHPQTGAPALAENPTGPSEAPENLHPTFDFAAAEWGFIVSAGRAARLGLPLGDPVRVLRGGRQLVVYQSLDLQMAQGRSTASQADVLAYPVRVARDLGMRIAGEVVQRVLPYSHEHGARHLNSVFYLPVE